MMVVRLFHWAFRVKVVPAGLPGSGELRRPRFMEAVFGIY